MFALIRVSMQVKALDPLHRSLDRSAEGLDFQFAPPFPVRIIGAELPRESVGTKVLYVRFPTETGAQLRSALLSRFTGRKSLLLNRLRE